MGFGFKTRVRSIINRKKQEAKLFYRHLTQIYSSQKDKNTFYKKIIRNYKECAWTPHSKYSVFTQYDKDYYLAKKKEFDKKYRYFYAVSKTIQPIKMIELGSFAGSSADAYISASPTVEYTGIDLFGSFIFKNQAIYLILIR